MTTRLAIAGVSERDIDLMLLEEVQSTPAFLEWFVAQSLGQDASLGQCIAAERSVTHSIGESDLEVLLQDDTSTRTLLMIENKVNAGLQPMQAQRYREKGRGYIDNKKCAAFHTIIVAPARYFRSSRDNKGFDTRLTYEKILKWYEQADQLGRRREYKIALLKSAIEKGVIGYQLKEDSPNTEFWREYWRLATKRAPALEMREPGPKPSRSGFIHFHPSRLPPGVGLFHKFNFGHVDIQLRGMGDRVNEVRNMFGKSFEDGMTPERAAKSAVIRVRVPPMRTNLGLAQQFDAACAGIDAAERLLRWFLANQNVWLRYKAGGHLRGTKNDPRNSSKRNRNSQV